jgi:hypothetical protein
LLGNYLERLNDVGFPEHSLDMRIKITIHENEREDILSAYLDRETICHATGLTDQQWDENSIALRSSGAAGTCSGAF